MKITEEASKSLADGFASIALQYSVPKEFPNEILKEAEEATRAVGVDGRPRWMAGRRDATDIPLMTLDPASSTDLDQAFALSINGDDIVLTYALADVGAFVATGSGLETEAWKRGVTIYGLADKVPVYPKVISQGAASLLPDGPRPAMLVTVAIDREGKVTFKSIERVICRSRAKLDYATVDLSKIPFLEEFADRMWRDEIQRGAIRVEFPQQEVIADPAAPGGVRLTLRAREYSETVNSALSLAVNLAIGALFRDAHTGIFRVMEEPTAQAIAQLRRVSQTLGIDWGADESLRDLQKRLSPDNMVHQQFLLDVRRAGGRASYALFTEGVAPWHSAIAATYSHATAPMRRLADRYALDLAFSIANKQPVPPALLEQIAMLPNTMSRCEGRAGNVDRAVIDLLEAVSLQNRIGEILEAEVVDAEQGVVQTYDTAIRAKATSLPTLANGAKVRVRIDESDPSKRRVKLTFVASY